MLLPSIFPIDLWAHCGPVAETVEGKTLKLRFWARDGSRQLSLAQSAEQIVEQSG